MPAAWEALRVLNIIFYGGILSGIIWRWRHLVLSAWPGFRWGLWLFFAASAYATVEVLWSHVPGGPRLVALTLSLGVLFVGCYIQPVSHWLRRRHTRKEKP